MSISLVQTANGSSGGYVNSFTAPFSGNVTAGSLLVLTLTAGTADALAASNPIVDNLGNTWTLAVNTNNTTTGARQTWCYYASNAISGSTTLTITYTTSDTPDSAWIMREYSGIATASPLDVTSNANDGVGFVQTHPAGTTLTTNQANELVILGGGVGVGSDPVLAAGSGYSNGLEQKGFDLFTYSFMSDAIISSTGTQTGNFLSTGFVQGQGYIATFKASSAPTVSSSGFFALF